MSVRRLPHPLWYFSLLPTVLRGLDSSQGHHEGFESNNEKLKFVRWELWL